MESRQKVNLAAERPLFEVMIPNFVNATKLLKSFCREVGGIINFERRQLNEKQYYFSQVQCNNIAGFGSDPSQRQASVKAVAEYFERKLLVDAKNNELKTFPRWRLSSNGFAVHFSQSEATQAAIREALERHLLQYSYLKWGWSGFNLVKKIVINDETLYFIVTRAISLNHQAGMVVVSSKRYPGLCFGYLCESREKILQTERWDHAISEAVDKIESYLKLNQSEEYKNLSNIESSIFDWMMNDQKIPNFAINQPLIELSTAPLEIISFDLKKRFNFDFPFYGSFAFGSDILPLIVPKSLSISDRLEVVAFLNHMGLPPSIPDKSPIL